MSSCFHMPSAASPLEFYYVAQAINLSFGLRSLVLSLSLSLSKINNLASLFQFIINFYAMAGIGTLFTNKCGPHSRNISTPFTCDSCNIFYDILSQYPLTPRLLLPFSTDCPSRRPLKCLPACVYRVLHPA